MNTVRRLHTLFWNLLLLISFAFAAQTIVAQTPSVDGPGNDSRPGGRPVVIPLTIKINSRQLEPETELQNVDLTVNEDGEPQTILSIRGVGTNSPITLAVLIQEDLVPSVANEIRSLAEFITGLPKGSRVMIGYLRTGSLLTKQRFTTDLDKAAKTLRPLFGDKGFFYGANFAAPAGELQVSLQVEPPSLGRVHEEGQRWTGPVSFQLTLRDR